MTKDNRTWARRRGAWSCCLVLVVATLNGCENTSHEEPAEPAEPARMMLQSKTWYWEKTVYNDGTVHVPNKPGVFSLAFGQDGRVAVTTDCNTMGGSYRVDGNQLQFEQMVSTRMHCEGSQEQLFSKMLDSVSSYFFTDDEQLVLEIKYDSGSILLR